jgi:hypothetical protein
MTTRTLFALLGAGALGTAGYARHRFSRRIDECVDALLAVPPPSGAGVFQARDVADVPEPARRYLAHAIPEGHPLGQSARVSQRGTFRSEEGGRWHPFTATQHIATAVPGFVWDARIALLPWVHVRVMDAYVGGSGELEARLASVIPVARMRPGPALNEGELLRYLAEAPWVPTALLPAMGVAWEAIDDRSARATLRDGATSASLVFTFNVRNEVERVSGLRPFRRDDGTTEPRAWVGRWSHYDRRGGLLVPTEGEVAWATAGRERPYWRGRVESVASWGGSGANPAGWSRPSTARRPDDGLGVRPTPSP